VLDTFTTASAYLESISENTNIADLISIKAGFAALVTENINSAEIDYLNQNYVLSLAENAGFADSAVAGKIICWICRFCRSW